MISRRGNSPDEGLMTALEDTNAKELAREVTIFTLPLNLDTSYLCTVLLSQAE